MNIEHNPMLSDPSEQLSFTIVAEGNAYCDKDWCAREISPPYTRLYYTLDGQGEITDERGSFPLLAGHLYMLSAGYSFSHSCSDRMHQLYFHVNLTNSRGMDVLRGIDRPLSKKISSEHIQKILSLYHGRETADRLYLKSLLQSDLFSLLLEHHIDIKEAPYSPPVIAALAYIAKHLSLTCSIGEIAAHLSLSPTTLSHKFKADMGVSIGKYIDGLVMHRAEHLLISTDMPLSRISALLGFCDQFYFSRRFKEKHATSPLAYRKAHQKL